jgi:hypothetical protein
MEEIDFNFNFMVFHFQTYICLVYFGDSVESEEEGREGGRERVWGRGRKGKGREGGSEGRCMGREERKRYHHLMKT